VPLGFSGCYLLQMLTFSLGGALGWGSILPTFGTLFLCVSCGSCGGIGIGAHLRVRKSPRISWQQSSLEFFLFGLTPSTSLLNYISNLYVTH
jgi:hypothetical protein